MSDKTQAKRSKKEFLVIGQQRRAGRRYAARGRRKMTRSNVKYARKPEGWAEWIMWLAGARFKYNTKPIPVSYRPWVPHVRETITRGGAEENAIIEWWRKNLPRRQYQHLMKLTA